MEELARRALNRLQDGDAIDHLAALVVTQTTATPMRDIASPRWLASQLAAGLEAATHGDMLRGWVDRRIDAERARLNDEERPLGHWLPAEADAPLRELLGRAYAPSEDLMFRIIDQPAVQSLVREMLTGSLRGFGKRLRAGEGSLGNVGARAKHRGRRILGGLGGFGENLGSVASQLGAGLGEVGRNMGDVAETLVGAVKDEVEVAFEGRVKDFAAQATTETIRSIARYIADPAHAQGFGELRVAILDVLLDTPLSELAVEADKLQPEQIVDVLVAAVRSAVSADDFVQRTEQRIASVLDDTGDGTLGAWLDEVGLAEVWTTTTSELVAARLRAVVHTEPFEAWWASLFAP